MNTFQNNAKESRTDFLRALQTSFFDENILDSDPSLRIQFIHNKRIQGAGEQEKVISELQEEFARCKSFDMSVAFVTDGGISLLNQTLINLKDKHIRGRILTTDYNNFTEPKALKKLLAFDNIEVKLYRCHEGGDGFHTKGYIFKDEDFCRVIIGSSNLTQNALTINKEWNIRIVGKESGELLSKIENEFEALWNSPNSFPLRDILDDYERQYRQLAEDRKKAREIIRKLNQQEPIHPNKMQKAFIKNLLAMYRNGKNRVMLISATGTGKTYAAAFAVQELMNLEGSSSRGVPLKIKRILFLVHREQITGQAKKSFSKIIGFKSGITYGIYSGKSKQKKDTFVFGTIQTVSKDDNLDSFSPDEFDLIIIDEVHRAGAFTYQKVMRYFKPKLWLGMTASPDRTDQFDIYSLFDHNIAYEIRLQSALEADLLCPFHYYGISDIKVGGLELDGDQFVRLQGKAKHIVEQAEYYGYSGERVKGLIFCSNLEAARELSRELNELNLKTLALSGSSSQEERNQAIERLTSDDKTRTDLLDYIITVDIFNEGVDIPELNQIIMLRPTVSPIIFIQQLGRGLRKSVGKEYVNILDFIASYKNNYLIPVALSGDNSYDKEVMRRTVSLGTKLIPGASTIEFDEVVKRKIFEAIDKARTNDISLLKESYHLVKFKLGKIPKLVDYSLHNGIDCYKFFQNIRIVSYYNFLKDKEKEDIEEIGEEKRGILEFLSKKVGLAKRIEEALLLELLLESKPEDRLKEKLKASLIRNKIEPTDGLIRSVTLILAGQFETTESGIKGNAAKAVLELLPDGDFRMSKVFASSLAKHSETYLDQIRQLVEFAKQRYEEKYSQRYKGTDFVLNETYTYADVCRLLNWDRNLNAQNIGGYFFDRKSKTLPVFINYHKSEESIPYEDKFESETFLYALSKTNRSLDSADRKNIYSIENKKYLFVRKDKKDDEAKSFYFLGTMETIGEPQEEVVLMDKETKKVLAVKDKSISSDQYKRVPVFKIKYKLETPVRKDIYDYITGEEI